MHIVEEYFNSKEKLLQKFKYDLDYGDLPIYDYRNCHWIIGENKIRYADDKKSLLFEYYENDLVCTPLMILDYTLFIARHEDSNRNDILIFSNSKQFKID